MNSVRQAADILRLSGIGRNQYIAILDACKAKKLLWRVNKNIAKEKLPFEPIDILMEPWWKVSTVNVGSRKMVLNLRLNLGHVVACYVGCSFVCDCCSRYLSIGSIYSPNLNSKWSMFANKGYV